MKKKTIIDAVAVLALAGVLFSGYLTYYTFASGRPGCEIFIFGAPSCFYGLVMYIAVFLLTLFALLKLNARGAATLALACVSFIGILFAAFLTTETWSAVSCTNFDILGQPPCIYGLVMYLIVLLLALYELRR
ncbi:MAG: hypothetical protein KGI04_01780 [Candidatus Micrarchaeota archaeon]|nr:hypothetical protein [Candidatus Micrarchaeota archaeon]